MRVRCAAQAQSYPPVPARGAGAVLSSCPGAQHRAARSSQCSPQNVRNMSRVYIGRLSYRAREKDVEKFFKGYGKILEVDLKNG